MNIEIKPLTSNQTQDFRSKALLDFHCHNNISFIEDTNLDSLHLGAIINDKLVCVLSFLKEKNFTLNSQSQFRLVGPITLPEFRDNQIGTKLIDYGTQILEEKRISQLWTQASQNNIEFYKRNLFKVIGANFDIDCLGQNILMFRNI